LLLLPCMAAEAQACTCAEYGTPPCAVYRSADATFPGVIADISEPQAEKESPFQYQVEVPLKGKLKPFKLVLKSEQ
jgi:hypothetical protein